MHPSAYALRIAGGLDVVRSDEYGYDEDLVSWKFRLRADGDIVTPAAVRTIK
jgi:hypothetical protein